MTHPLIIGLTLFVAGPNGYTVCSPSPDYLLQPGGGSCYYNFSPRSALSVSEEAVVELVLSDTPPSKLVHVRLRVWFQH